MDGTEEKKDTLQQEAGQSSTQTQETSTQTPETYTKEQTQKLLSDALAEQGRKHKAELTPITKERDDLKTQIQSKESELTDVASERDDIRKQLEELSGDDPQKFNLVAKDKELREQARKLKTERDALDSDKQAHQERIKLAEDTLREVTIWDITSKYEGGDPVRLKGLCDIMEASSEEQIQKVAETLWSKKTPDTPPTPPVKPYSGMTSGGTGFTYDQKNPEKTLQEGFKQLKK